MQNQNNVPLQQNAGKSSSKIKLREKEILSSIITLGELLTIEQVVQVARNCAKVKITSKAEIIEAVHKSCEYISKAVESGQPIYGVTSGFGGMANVVIQPELAAQLQSNLVRYHKVGAGEKLSVEDVRAAMLLRANSHLKGVSGIRLEVIQRIEIFLNAGITPHVYSLGSIGASGDLTPLSYITGALFGLDRSYKVDMNGEEVDALTALSRVGLPPLQLQPKEGLAMMNGTSVMTGIASSTVHDAQVALELTLSIHALFIQGLNATNQSFHPFIHQHKPQVGQIVAASCILDLLQGSSLIRDELDGSHQYRGKQPIQDRYSIRCLPQFIGPIIEGIKNISKQIEVEINSVTDNPLIDVNNQASYHGGNFLGQHVGIAMDQLRYYIGILAKHLDTQIALLVTPEFNNGLSASLTGNTERLVNMGLKGLQITGNSILPLLTFYGNSIVDRFPTHAEQFNQNINSQGFNSANLARRSTELFQQYLALALIFAVQAVDLRTFTIAGHYNASKYLSPATRKLYLAVRNIVKKPCSHDYPYIWNDDEQFLDEHIAFLAHDIASDGQIVHATNKISW